MSATVTSIESINGYRLRFIDKKYEVPKDIDLSCIVKSKNGWWTKKLGETQELGTQVYYSKDKKHWIKGYRDRKSINPKEPGGRTQVGKYIYRAKEKGTTVATIGRNVITWYTFNGIRSVNYNKEIDHVDGDYTNDRADNLERVTPSQNIKRRIKKEKANEKLELQMAGA